VSFVTYVVSEASNIDFRQGPSGLLEVGCTPPQPSQSREAS
jgi:hypothetical protein